MIRLRRAIQAALPCLCAFLLMGLYALELLPRLNLTAVNLICILLACLSLFPGIVNAVNTRKAECFSSSLLIAAAALAVNLRGQLPPSLSALSAWEALWAGLAAVSTVCLAAVLLRLLRWSQENWEQERANAQERRRNRRESRRSWWRTWGQYRDRRLAARWEYKENLEALQTEDRLNRTKIQIRYRECLLKGALEAESAPKKERTDKKPADEKPMDERPAEESEEVRTAKKSTASDHIFTCLILAVVLIIIIGIPFAVKVGPGPSTDLEAEEVPYSEESAGESQETYFNQWITAVNELILGFTGEPADQSSDSGSQQTPAQRQESTPAEGSPLHNPAGKDTDKGTNAILKYIGLVGLLILIFCLTYYILLLFVRRKLRGQRRKQSQKNDSEQLDLIDSYAVPMAFLMISLLALYVLGSNGSMSDIPEILKDLLIAIFFILILLFAFEVVRLVLEQCGWKYSTLKRVIFLSFIAVLDFLSDIIFGVLKGLHIESAISSLLTLVLPGNPDEIPSQALEKIKRIFQNQINAVNETAKNSANPYTGAAGGNSFTAHAKPGKAAAHTNRFFRRKVWRRGNHP